MPKRTFDPTNPNDPNNPHNRLNQTRPHTAQFRSGEVVGGEDTALEDEDGEPRLRGQTKYHVAIDEVGFGNPRHSQR